MAVTISELARTAGVGVETIRFYQRKGLLFDPHPSRQGRSPGTRHYGQDDIRRLRFIRSAQKAGFALREISELLELDATSERERARELARQRIASLDRQIAELRQARQSLDRLARECSRGGAGPCPIIEAFE
ncbi:MAG: MerR family transcriptional regulator [Novosphingobium sp.]